MIVGIGIDVASMAPESVDREKLKDDCATARVYGEIIGLPEAPSYARRFYGYFMARCPGREEEAYEYLMDLYREGERQQRGTQTSGSHEQ